MIKIGLNINSNALPWPLTNNCIKKKEVSSEFNSNVVDKI